VPRSTGTGELISATDYDRRHGGVFYNQLITSAPNGVSAVADLDLLGRTIRERAENRLVSPPTSGIWTDTDLDPAGNVQSTTVHYPGGDVRTEHDYSVFGELLETRSFANAATDKVSTSRWAYDARGFMTSSNGPRPNDLITYTYDAAGRITKVEQPDLVIPGSSTPVYTGVVYSAAGERLRVRTPLRYENGDFVYLARRWTYDAAGHMTSFADDAGTTTYAYTDAGWLTRAAVDGPEVGDDLTRRFRYDDLGRITGRWVGEVAMPQGTEKSYFAYDRASNQVCAADATGAVQSRYDHTGRLDAVFAGGTTDCALSDQQSIDPPATATLVTDYVYDDAAGGVLDKIKDLQLGAGTAGQTALTYDALGRPVTLNDPLTPGITEYTWDGAGRLSTTEYHAGTDPGVNTDVVLHAARTYENYSGRLGGLAVMNAAASELLFSWLTYDLSGNITRRTQRVGGAADTWDYTYDNANRL